MSDQSHTEDEKLLRQLGYEQELSRRMSGFSNFAISLSIICILAGGITSFHVGLCSAGGASIGLGWPLVCLFSLCVAGTMAQVASAFPTAGGLYHWGSILGGRACGWVTAWFNLAGLVTVLAAINAGTYDFAVAAFDVPKELNTDATRRIGYRKKHQRSILRRNFQIHLYRKSSSTTLQHASTSRNSLLHRLRFHSTSIRDLLQTIALGQTLELLNSPVRCPATARCPALRCATKSSVCLSLSSRCTINAKTATTKTTTATTHRTTGSRHATHRTHAAHAAQQATRRIGFLKHRFHSIRWHRCCRCRW